MLRLGIDPEKLYRATFMRQYGLCCCNMALISFRLFRKNVGNLRDVFGQMVYRPPSPWQKIPRTPMLNRYLKRNKSIEREGLSLLKSVCDVRLKRVSITAVNKTRNVEQKNRQK